MPSTIGTIWQHCEKHNIDYPLDAFCPLCESVSSQMIRIRLKKRKTPRGQIECPIEGTVKPSICLLCAFTNNCPSYYAHVTKKHKISNMKYAYWKLRAKLSEFRDWLWYIWNFTIKPLKEDVGIIMAFTPIAFFVAIAILILSGILKVHIGF